jgi:hypothetical protein
MPRPLYLRVKEEIHWYAFNLWLGGPQKYLGLRGEENDLFTHPKIEPSYTD